MPLSLISIFVGAAGGDACVEAVPLLPSGAVYVSFTGIGTRGTATATTTQTTRLPTFFGADDVEC